MENKSKLGSDISEDEKLNEDAPTVTNILICKTPANPTDDDVLQVSGDMNYRADHGLELIILFDKFKPTEVKVFFFKENNRLPLTQPSVINMKEKSYDSVTDRYSFVNKTPINFKKSHELEMGAEFEAVIYIKHEKRESARKVTVPYFLFHVPPFRP